MTWDLSNYSATPASNTAINGINLAENCNASGLNDAIRQIMADLATAGIQASPFTHSGDGAALTGAMSYTLPGGLIIKSGFALPNTNVDVVFPVAFPNKILGCGATMMESTGGGAASRSCDAYPTSASQMQITSSASGAGFQACWFAWGY